MMCSQLLVFVAGALFAGLPFAAALSYFPPPDSAGGWRTPRDAEHARRQAGIDVAKLEHAYEEMRRVAPTPNGGLLVVRDGWLVFERYFGYGHRDSAPNLASCGKSFTSIAVGILLAERPDLFPDGLEQRVFTPQYFPPEVFPLADPERAAIKLGQLLAFTSGIRGQTPGRIHGRSVELAPAGPDGWEAMDEDVAHGRRDAAGGLTTRTLWIEPGGGYSYATSAIHLASVMLRHIAGMEMEEFIRRRIAEPCGWENWSFGYKTRPLRHTPGGGGIALRGTDMLRFGYLLLHEGRWGDRQIVPAEYVRHCGQRSPYNPHSPYSLQFTVNSEGDAPGVPRDAYWKNGSGGHCFYIVPSARLVIWQLAGRDEQYDPRNTGLTLPHAVRSRPASPSQSGGAASPAPRNDAHETLRRVLAACEPSGRN